MTSTQKARLCGATEAVLILDLIQRVVFIPGMPSMSRITTMPEAKTLSVYCHRISICGTTSTKIGREVFYATRPANCAPNRSGTIPVIYRGAIRGATFIADLRANLLSTANNGFLMMHSGESTICSLCMISICKLLTAKQALSSILPESPPLIITLPVCRSLATLAMSLFSSIKCTTATLRDCILLPLRCLSMNSIVFTNSEYN
mmetsp:Transcript_61556/g.98064  ORF Transcript_61556/g.98064 Transcript_61556/m.98064 type:complete len:204 (+) Transcript_61556:107-718(+)